MGYAGGEASTEAKEECSIAAFGPWLAESLKCFHEWMDSQMPQLLREQVSSSVLGHQSCTNSSGESFGEIWQTCRVLRSDIGEVCSH